MGSGRRTTVRQRIDDVPILGEYIKPFLAEKNHIGFIFNSSYLTKYMETSDAERKDTPGFTSGKKYGIFTTFITILENFTWNF